MSPATKAKQYSKYEVKQLFSSRKFKPAKRGRGRPKKTAQVETSLDKKATKDFSETVKRGRGRPRKTEQVDKAPLTPIVKRGRGRPRKNVIESLDITEDDDVLILEDIRPLPAKRARGRPRNSEPVTTSLDTRTDDDGVFLPCIPDDEETLSPTSSLRISPNSSSDDGYKTKSGSCSSFSLSPESIVPSDFDVRLSQEMDVPPIRASESAIPLIEKYVEEVHTTSTFTQSLQRRSERLHGIGLEVVESVEQVVPIESIDIQRINQRKRAHPTPPPPEKNNDLAEILQKLGLTEEDVDFSKDIGKDFVLKCTPEEGELDWVKFPCDDFQSLLDETCIKKPKLD